MAVPVPSTIFQVAVPAPLRRCFDYTALDPLPRPSPGVRVRVPFGRRELIGVLISVRDESSISREQLRPVLKVLDREPVLSGKLLGLLQWAADYYHHPLGDVLKTALPVTLRQGRDLRDANPCVWSVTPAGRDLSATVLGRAPLQKKILAALSSAPAGLGATQLGRISRGWRGAMQRMVENGWVMVEEQEPLEMAGIQRTRAPSLTPAQRTAVTAIVSAFGSYETFVLEGVTGSGKTEVYLGLIEQALVQRKQALVLVPEIGLTPQFVKRVRDRFDVSVAVLHSGLTDHERLRAWLMARNGKAPIVIGTRSAVFTPMTHLGVIIVDEEHDPSYKQQDGFRYNARDIAVMRAHRENVPIVLGSATPSLDTLQNIVDGGYQALTLPARVGMAQLPDVRLLDLRRLPVNDGLSPPLVEQIHQRLQKGEQSLLFINQRGYAPAYMCHTCGWLAPCRRCDAKLTFHKHSDKLCCHHCGIESRLPDHCPQCQATKLQALGEGTERVETALRRVFPDARIMRVDRDSTRRKGALEKALHSIGAGAVDILVGTQMLSKGHDFPNVTLVGVVNADQRLYSVDFHAAEQLVQQIIQVSGRAGRGAKPGEVWIQTYHPDNAVFAALRRHDYRAFADFALAERKAARFPPFAHLALLRSESPRLGAALQFVRSAHRLAQACLMGATVELMDPVPSPMERRAGRYRAQLLVQSCRRKALHQFIARWLTRLDETPAAKRVRWSLDVDPIDMH